MNEELMMKVPLMKQWVRDGSKSNNFPVFWEIIRDLNKPPSPFKFNVTWLDDEDFQKTG